MKTELKHIECDCKFVTSELMMIHSWLDGRVIIMTYYGTPSKSTVVIDEEIKCSYNELKIEEFNRLIANYQEIADKMENKAA